MTDDTLRDYREAISRGDAESLSAVFAENVQLRVPLFSEPLVGRQTVAGILSVLFGAADAVRLGEAFTGSDGYAIALTLEVGGVELEGLERVHFDDDGLVDVLLVALRPLEALITMHNTIAPLLGQPRLELVARAS